MNQATFVWTLKSSITLQALGRTVNNLSLDKALVLQGKEHKAYCSNANENSSSLS